MSKAVENEDTDPIDVDEGEVSPQLVQPDGHLLADALGTSGDEDDLSGDVLSLAGQKLTYNRLEDDQRELHQQEEGLDDDGKHGDFGVLIRRMIKVVSWWYPAPLLAVSQCVYQSYSLNCSFYTFFTIQPFLFDQYFFACIANSSDRSVVEDNQPVCVCVC